MSENLLHQKQAKFDALTKALGEIALCPRNSSVLSGGTKPSVKLFGTSLKYQLDETDREIPDIVESCAKYIARFGEWLCKSFWLLMFLYAEVLTLKKYLYKFLRGI